MLFVCQTIIRGESEGYFHAPPPTGTERVAVMIVVFNRKAEKK